MVKLESVRGRNKLAGFEMGARLDSWSFRRSF